MTSKPSTLLEALQDSIRFAGRYQKGEVTAPAAILWTDADGQWKPLVEEILPLLPELFILGDYDPEKRTGPAIWLRCISERTLPDLDISDDTIPVFYLPNISRQTLRAAEECPDSLKPLVELQFRGTVWTQRNGRDWTVDAFVMSDAGGLGLDLARDQKTRNSLFASLRQLAVTPISGLRDRRLEAEDFDRLMVEDTVCDLLLWMNNPKEIRGNWSAEKWTAFRSRCQADYAFDPESDGDIVAGENLGKREGAWLNVWKRFKESPTLYPGLPDLLSRSKPGGMLVFDKEPWPDENRAEEDNLRQKLLSLESSNSKAARILIKNLESLHGSRRNWVWVRLGKSALAESLEHLSVLSRYTEQVLGGDRLEAIEKLYTQSGFMADDAVLKSLACVKNIDDTKAVVAAIRSIYIPWLEQTTQHVQELLTHKSISGTGDMTGEIILRKPGQCLLFCDGLRFDLGQRLVIVAEARGMRVLKDHRWAALPTVTATAKPAVSPIAGKISGKDPGVNFQPDVSKSGQPLTTDRFRKILTETNIQVLGPADTGTPQETAAAWTEGGEFDSLGHKLDAKIAARIDEELELLLNRIQRLLEAGWKEVRVITDHGWLLVPGGLPSFQLPKYLTESRWSRCASIKETSKTDIPLASWHWNRSARFAYAPGIHCFTKGHEYAHGGVSLQECIIPDLIFRMEGALGTASIDTVDVQWVGMRCRVTVSPVTRGITADIRTKPNDPSSSVTELKPFDENGKVGLLVTDDSWEGTAVSVIITDLSGNILRKESTTVGGEK